MAHGHAHDHHHGGRRYAAAAVIQAIFVCIEALCGLVLFPNPAIVADAGHNVSDVAFAVFAGVIDRVTHGRSHRVSQHFPKYVGIGMCFATIAVIGGVVIWEATKAIHPSGISLGVTAGLGISAFAVNKGIGMFLKRSPDAMSQATGQHFESDAKVSLVLIVIAAVALWEARPAMIIGAVLITLWTAWDNLHLAADIRRDLLECRARDVNPNQMELPFQRST